MEIIIEIILVAIYLLVAPYIIKHIDQIKRFFIIIYYENTNQMLLDDAEELYLKSYCSYYNNLDKNDQIIFKYRLRKLKPDIEFVFRGHAGRHKEKKIAILANQVKLTFGLRCYKFDAFERIVVYPTEYKSHHTGQLHIGETNPGLSTIVMSWRDVYDGIKITKDNLNVALHELTHALYFSMKYNTECEPDFFDNHQKIIDYVNKHKKKMIADDIIRAYAFADDAETVPVLIEHFFENPEVLQLYYPKLFGLIVRLLKQNPLEQN